MVRLISPIARARIGNDEFLTGDRLLRSVEVTLNENARASKCRFEIYDPDLTYANQYFEMSFQQGGIQVPYDLLQQSGQTPRDYSYLDSDPTSHASDLNVSTGTASQNISPHMRAMLDTIAWSELAGLASNSQNGYNILYGGGTFSGYSRFPSNGVSGRYQFEPDTWRSLGQPDFSPASQDAAAVKLIARRGVLAQVEAGDVEGALRGNGGLAPSGYPSGLSWEWASLPPNRGGIYANQQLHSMDEVKAYYAKALAKYQSTSQPTTAAPASQPQIVDKADTKPVEISQRGTEIIIELGYQIDQLVAYHFIHTATEAKGRKLDTTSFEGQCIRWLMTRRTKNTTYSNITLRELAGKIAKSHGLKLEMEGDGPTYQFLDQTGITDMELLLRECRAIGYTIQDDKNKLILKPIRPNFTGFVITQDILIDIQFKDKAEADRQGIGGQNATTPVTQSTPDNPAAEAKAKIDRLTGSVVQQKPEDSTAMGKAGSAQQSSNDVLQQAKAALTGVFGNTLNLDTAKLAASGAGSTTANSGTVAVSGSPSKAVTGTPAPESSTEPVKAGVGQIDPATNLPVQQIGSIELATGQAQAQLLVDINRRVRGYESTATVITTPEVLELAPGSIIGISSNIVPSAFAKEWRVSSVTHSLRPGQFRTTIEFYTPLAYGGRDLSLVNDNSPSSTPSNVPTGKLLNPLPGAQRGTPFDPHGKIRGRAHTGIDLSDGQYSPVQAAESGTVVYVGNQDAGGYGNEVVIAHDGDWKGFTTVYAHLSAFNVSQGQRVTRGQVIGREGATGDSSGPHLHFELHEGTDQSKTNLKDPELYICPPPTGIYDEGAGTPLKCNCPGH